MYRLFSMGHFLDFLKLQYRRLRIGASLHRNDALGALHRAWGYVHATQMVGDYYEFGVYRGASLINSRLSQQHFRRHLERSRDLPFLRQGTVALFLEHSPTFYGFDTFAGMPDNAEGEDSLAPGSFKADFDAVLRRCRHVGLGPPALQLFPGLFSQTSHNIGPHPAAIVHVDCDLFASAADALSAIAPRLTQGTILLFDDYNLFRADNCQGERRALAEFLRTHDITVEPWFAYGPASQAFICHHVVS
ncbi:Macrocin-O-methyltransferase (TylF) [Magnetospirillum gryphiswaldense MSR-1]|uniref:Methyltransferase n=2 Tax=Magnetospirillum gryphiswaldense TaxID=55518 RepID=A4TX95_9PROT|nr:Macrocin-O-methyltransferase (TylF) [Magnetospirillum gryphiswaldense MSR-1]AVM77075.1 Macrocin-O-methyltransferase (TylF) [Magnetospirillum gryphiswaldense]CAM75252.1 methyltransferase [Magnetospirillum gryphiswaldense MSR-1]